MRRIACDLDGTLLPEGPACDRFFAEPKPEVLEELWRAKNKGCFVALYSARPWGDYRMTEEWLGKHAVPYDTLILGKYNFDFLLDDRASNNVEDLKRFIDAS